jgi:hypothetical protein
MMLPVLSCTGLRALPAVLAFTLLLIAQAAFADATPSSDAPPRANLSSAAPSAGLTAPPANVNTLPQLIKATYRVFRNGLLIGQLEERFERTGDRYRIVSQTRADGAVALFVREELSAQSEGRISPTGLVPSSYSTSRKNDSSRNFTTRFDWSRNELIRDSIEDGKPERETFELPRGAQDRLSSLYQFMVVAPRGDVVVALMTQGKQTEQYRYLKEGEPTLNTGAGSFATVHFKRDTRAGESKAELWLAKDRFFLPVRAVFTDKRGTAIEQSLIELSIS